MVHFVMEQDTNTFLFQLGILLHHKIKTGHLLSWIQKIQKKIFETQFVKVVPLHI